MTRVDTATQESLERREALYAGSGGLLERMIEIRVLEDRLVSMFAEGLVHGTTHTSQGQEAVAVGLASASRIDDQVMCTYRGHGMALALGVPPRSVICEVMGKDCGSIGGVGGSIHLSNRSVGLMPTSAIIGSGIPIAVGAGLTAQVLETGNAAIAVFGDGAVNIGAFHEALNLASVWRLPILFVCENNLYAEFSRIDRTTPFEDLARRADAYDIPAAVVDGQDVQVVAANVREALERIRSGNGPEFLEMKTYRFAGHSRADTGPYRPEGELDQWLERDPITIFGNRLLESGEIDQETIDAMWRSAQERIDSAVSDAESAQEPPPKRMFEHVEVSGKGGV